MYKMIFYNFYNTEKPLLKYSKISASVLTQQTQMITGIKSNYSDQISKNEKQ